MLRASSTRRLPGFSFEVQAPSLTEVLPRMDVAIFVGFAASGPLELPVAVESTAQFHAIFGADAPLAWDQQRGTQIYSYLAPAVRAFFRNGGVRCWVVRVARQAIDERDLAKGFQHNCVRRNYFPLPGLARARFDHSGNVAAVLPAFARARANGSWSDSLQLSTVLQTRSMQISQVVRLDGVAPVFDLALASPNDLSNGDLLRFTFEAEGYVLLATVSNIQIAPPSSPPVTASLPGRRAFRVTTTKPVWYRGFGVDEFTPPDGRVTVSTYTFEPESLTAANLDSEEDRTPNFEFRSEATVVRQDITSPPSSAGDLNQVLEQTLTLDLVDLSFRQAPQPGSLLRVKFPGQSVLMAVLDVSLQRNPEQAREFARVSGPAVLILPRHPDVLPANLTKLEKLSLELWVHKDDEYAISLKDLGYASSHARFWGSLPTDEEVYDQNALENGSPSIVWWEQTGDVLSFPIAGSVDNNEIFFPFAMSALPDRYLGAIDLPGTALERDGLASFDASLFLDDSLIDSGVESLIGQSEFVRYLSAQPRSLHGIHAAIGQEEPTLIAVPDALHRGWELIEEGVAPAPLPSLPLLRPEWWRFRDCKSSLPIEPVANPEWGNFLNCVIRVIPAPVLSESEPVSQSGTYTLSWSFDSSILRPHESVNFVLEEATTPDFTGAVTIYEGSALNLTIYGRRPGDYYYRVRAIVGENSSNYSSGQAIRVSSINRWRLIDATEYQPDTLLAVQRALLRMCAARGDLLALLSLPEHHREDQALDHVATLKLTPERTPATANVAPLGYGEARAFSYGAVYHPWLVGREENEFDRARRTPPCGALSGILASRAIKRGAWIAPANETVRDVVTLFPPILRQRRESLQLAQINLIRQEPRGFLSLSADTLSDDGDFRPINVRRLLMLLRRMALRLGATYVFEPHSPAFRRLVERGFNAMLDHMFVRGAFAGRTPATSYQVVTGPSLNTPQSTELGRFIVELRVAPSLPMTFLTVRLVQTGDRGLVTEGRT